MGWHQIHELKTNVKIFLELNMSFSVTGFKNKEGSKIRIN